MDIKKNSIGFKIFTCSGLHYKSITFLKKNTKYASISKVKLCFVPSYKQWYTILHINIWFKAKYVEMTILWFTSFLYNNNIGKSSSFTIRSFSIIIFLKRTILSLTLSKMILNKRGTSFFQWQSTNKMIKTWQKENRKAHLYNAVTNPYP